MRKQQPGELPGAFFREAIREGRGEVGGEGRGGEGNWHSMGALLPSLSSSLGEAFLYLPPAAHPGSFIFWD